jgi:hypothetical protein
MPYPHDDKKYHHCRTPFDLFIYNLYFIKYFLFKVGIEDHRSIKGIFYG